MSYLPTFEDTDNAWRQFGDTVGAVLAARAAERREADCVRLLEDNGAETVLSYAGMLARVRRAAAGLEALGVRPGMRVLVVLPTGFEFLETFFGTLLAGGTAVPCYPPLRSKGLADYRERLARLIATARPEVIVTFDKVRLVVEAAAFDARCGARVVDARTLPVDAAAYVAPPVDPEAIALIQFSSGSTGHPRGVMLSHRALLSNVAAVLSVIAPDEQDALCSWLPLYHDMGLIGGPFMSIFAGAPLILLSPQAFLLDPKRWLRAIDRHKATISTAPNFAYQILASRLDAQELAGLDLSSWRLALCGAEPVLPGTLEAVERRLAPYGFRAGVLMPVYGLAEMALGAVFSAPGGGYRVDTVAADGLAEDAMARPVVPGAAAPIVRIPSVGRTLPGFDVRVVKASGEAAAPREVGEITLSGPSMMAGYLNDAAATADVMTDGWLRTGDLGYLADGELYVVGRSKDLILKGGRNYVPQDLENAAEGVDGVRHGCVVAFGVLDEAAGTEAIVVIAESRTPEAGHAGLAAAIADRVHAVVGLRPDTVAIVAPGVVPKTSSGKLQRRRTRERWLSGTLAAPQEPGTLGMAKVMGLAMAQRMIVGPLARGWSKDGRR